VDVFLGWSLMVVFEFVHGTEGYDLFSLLSHIARSVYPALISLGLFPLQLLNYLF
jgi:hypothetical protein